MRTYQRPRCFPNHSNNFSFVKHCTVPHQWSKGFHPLELIYLPFLLVDIFYIFGGSTDPEDEDGVSYEVIPVNLKTGDVGQASDTLHATNSTATSASLHRIALCGGDVAQATRDYCQMYSPERDEYV